MFCCNRILYISFGEIVALDTDITDGGKEDAIAPHSNNIIKAAVPASATISTVTRPLS
jgi:hypothetical protein